LGTKSRLHRQAVVDGKEQPFRQKESPHKLLRCGKCKELMGEVNARDHIRKCWSYPIKDDEPLPDKPIVVNRKLSDLPHNVGVG